jgi:hypothetical protein
MRLVFDYVNFRFISKHSGFALPIIIPSLFHISFSSRGWTAGPLEAVVPRRQPRPTKNIKTDAPFFFAQATADVRWFSFVGYCTVRSVSKGYKIISNNLVGR